MKISELLEKNLDIAKLWESKYLKYNDILAATIETCFETKKNHKEIFEIITKHIKEKNILTN